MIGVIADFADQEVVCEFFEMFKTPWEFYRSDRLYDAILCVGDGRPDQTAKLVVLYAGGETHFDKDHRIQTGCQRTHPCFLMHRGNRIPVYGNSVTFPNERNAILTDADSQQCSAYLYRSGERMLARIGYHLFSEVRMLLTVGQPPANAEMPALELHIALLRNLITGCGVPLAEVPPVPDVYPLIACLTHDVDHPSIRQHKWDHTAFGFLFRALFGSLREVIRGRMPLRGLVANWVAALKLPLVHLGLARDFW